LLSPKAKNVRLAGTDAGQAVAAQDVAHEGNFLEDEAMADKPKQGAIGHDSGTKLPANAPSGFESPATHEDLKNTAYSPYGKTPQSGSGNASK